MKRVTVPGGGWFDLRDLSDLTSDHQEQYLDLGDELRQAKRDALAALPPVNPAVMPDPADETPVRLTRKDTGPIRELVQGWMVADASFGMPLPRPLPLLAANVLRDALESAFGALNGEVPKESPESASTSGGTSPEPVPAPLPE
jgi:hypothetical protein